MTVVTNISITERAQVALGRERKKTRLGDGEVFALLYVFKFAGADGVTVEGFEPGYAAVAWSTAYLSSRWIVARLPDGLEIHFMPRFTWRSDRMYLIDLIGALFSIDAVQ